MGSNGKDGLRGVGFVSLEVVVDLFDDIPKRASQLELDLKTAKHLEDTYGQEQEWPRAVAGSQQRLPATNGQ